MEKNVSDTDSFIEEVSEEVRRDRLFKIFKKYAWVAVLVVVLLVGGAAFNEYNKLSNQKRAASLGDELYKIIQLDVNDQMPELESVNPKLQNGKAIVNFMQVNSLLKAGKVSEAIKILDDISSNSGYDNTYREMADFKSIILSSSDVSEKLLRLESYSEPGSAFRTIALEEISLIQIKLGDFEKAIDTLTITLQEPGLSQNQAKRISELLRTLDGAKGTDAKE
jgi:hypothetical protein